MSLVAVDALREYLKEPTAKAESLQQALNVAEALVAGYIGAEGLEKKQYEETWHPRLDTRILATVHGPVTGVLSVLVNGEDVSASTGYTYWSLRLQRAIGNGDVAYATYEAGWAADTLPDRVTGAILMTAASVYARPDAGLARIVNPNLAEVYRADYLSVSARKLLDAYKAPGAVL